MPALGEYEWVYVLAGFAMVGATFGIGANDGANPWATPVGSKALSLRWAYALAVVCEIAGAVGGGAPVAKTIRKGIADVECFEGGRNDAAILMYGNFSVLVVVGIWLVAASVWEMPVSTTHTAVAGMVGMAWAAKGSGCVVWYEAGSPGQWEIPRGMAGIFLSWAFSPLLSGLISALLFAGVRRFILRSSNPFDRAVKFYPILVFMAVTIMTFFMLAKGISKKLCPKKTGDWLCSGGATRGEVAFGVALAVGATVAAAGVPLFRKVGQWAREDTARKQWIRDEAAIAARPQPVRVAVILEDEEDSGDEPDADPDALRRNSSYREATAPEPEARAESPSEWCRRHVGAAWANVRGRLSRWGTMDLHATALASPVVADIHDNAEVFDPSAEAVFCYIQVFTAMADSFAHGANDVANGVGAYMSVNHLYKTGEVESKTDLDENDAYLILAGGGAGIALGLSIMGWRMIRVLGIKMCKVTPSRGFAIELGAALVLILGSYKGMPLSSTHCQIGATIGVALLDGKAGLNMHTVRIAAFGLIATLFAAGLSAAALTSQAIFAPSVGRLHDLSQDTCTGIGCDFNTTIAGTLGCVA